MFHCASDTFPGTLYIYNARKTHIYDVSFQFQVSSFNLSLLNRKNYHCYVVKLYIWRRSLINRVKRQLITINLVTEYQKYGDTCYNVPFKDGFFSVSDLLALHCAVRN
jgi:hypothetical protein